MRMLGEELVKELKTNVVIENKAGGVIGTAEIARAKPDGYTIGSGQVGGGTPEEFGKFIQDERAKWAEVIKEASISVEQ